MMVVMTGEIIQTAANIFSNVRDKDDRSIEDNHLYNLDTIRIRRKRGDTSKRRLFMSYFGTTIRRTKQVS